MILVAALGACAWAIFTSGAVTHGDTPPPVLVPDSLVPASIDTTPPDSLVPVPLDTIPPENPKPEGE
jgi:hypothetical protein